MTSKRMPEFNPDKLELGCWIDLFTMNCQVNDITDDDAKRALLLSSVGVDTFATICKLTAPDLPSAVAFNDLVTVLKSHFITKPSYHRALCDFLQRKKKSNETVKGYYAELKQLAQQCEFGAEFDRRLKEQLLVGIDQEIYFKVLLADPFDFKVISSRDLLTKVTSLETAYVTECNDKASASNGSSESSSVHKVKAGGGKPSSYSVKNKPPGLVTSKAGNCFRCGRSNHLPNKCNFKDATCFSCGKTGHVSSVCLSKKGKGNSKVHALNEVTVPSEEENFSLSYDLCKLFDTNINAVDSLSEDTEEDQPYMVVMEINGIPMEFELDSGSGVSTMSIKDVEKLHLSLSPKTKRLRNYGKTEIKVYGQIRCDVTFKGKVAKNQLFFVVDDNVNLAGRVLMRNFNYNWVEVDAVKCNNSISRCIEMFDNYEVKENLPILDYECNLQLKENAMPRYFKARSVPYHYKVKIEKSLKELEKFNIISKIEHAGEWASPIVPVVKSNGDVRVCVDFKYVNTQTKINTFPLPKLEDILANLGPYKYISKLDLKNAYLQLAVSDDSQKYLVMNTHLGLYKFHRLPFGLSSAPGIFQRFNTELLANVEGVQVFLDDIVVVGDTQEEHDNRLCEVLSILQKRNVKLNKSKCQIRAKEVPYLGYILSGEGIKPDPKKIQAILEAPTPTSVSSLKSFLGLCTYYNRFVPRFSSILCPLYNLTQKDVQFQWTTIHEQAFNSIKMAMAEANILENFNPEAKLILEVDASPVGVGAVLKQEFQGRISTIAFKSRKLSKAESHYGQIDKEALSIVFGVKKFSDFLLGKEFIIRTDHKPLIHIFDPDKKIPQMSNARIQRWALFLSAFKFDIEHIKGENNTVADALSRLPLQWDDPDFHVPGEYVNLITILNSNESFDFKLVKECTGKDTLFCQVIEYVKNGFPNVIDLDDSILPFYKIRSDLALHEDVLLYRNRVVVPEILRKHVMDVLHEGHKGIVAMKAEARSMVYWPKMDEDINQVTANCSLCVVNLKPKDISPLSWPSPDRPWSRLHVDYCGPMENYQFLIIIDSYSKFIDVFPCKIINSVGTIECFKKCFANFGIPDTVVSDNASCFMSKETQDFFKKYNIQHCSGAPYNPSTNGLAERAVRIFKENFKKFDVKLPVSTRICKFLYSYRRSVQSSTNSSPAELMFGRKFKGPLDIIMPKSSESSEDFDSKFKVGDAVYARNFGKGPEWVEAKVTKVLGMRNYLVCVNVNGNLIWKRHLSQLFERKLFSSNETYDSSPSNVTCNVPVMSPIPVSTLPNTVRDSNVINMPNDIVVHDGSNQQSVLPDVNNSVQPQNRPNLLRKSTRIIKKPDRLIEKDT